MILFILLVLTSVHWAEQHLTYPINYCQLAAVCIHDHSMVCAATEDGCSRRTFLDQCDMYEYNCDFGAHCRETYKLFCLDSELGVENPPPLSYHRPAPCVTQPVYCFTGTPLQMISTTPAPCIPNNTPAPCVPNTSPAPCVPNTSPAPSISTSTSTTTSTKEASVPVILATTTASPPLTTPFTYNIFSSVEPFYSPTTPIQLSFPNWPSESQNTLPPRQPTLTPTSLATRPPTTTPTTQWILWLQKSPKTLPPPPSNLPPTSRETLPPTTIFSSPPTVIWPAEPPKSSPNPQPTLPPTSEETLVPTITIPSLINWPPHKQNTSPRLPPSLPTPRATRPPTTTPTVPWIIFPTTEETEEPTIYPPKILLWPPVTPKTAPNIRHITQTFDLPTLTTWINKLPPGYYFDIDANSLPDAGVYSISPIQEESSERTHEYVTTEPTSEYVQSSEQTNEHDKSSEPISEHNKSPEPANEHDKSPEPANEHDQSPEETSEPVQSSEQTNEPVQSSEPTNEPVQSPERLLVSTSSPQPLPVYTYPPTPIPVFTYPPTPISAYTYPPPPIPVYTYPPTHIPGHFHPPGTRPHHAPYYDSPEQAYSHDYSHYGSGECSTCEIIESCEICNLRFVNKNKTIKKLLPIYSRPLKNSVIPTPIVNDDSKIGTVAFSPCCDRPKTWITREEIRIFTTDPRTTNRKLSTNAKTQPTDLLKVEKSSTTTAEASSTPSTTTEAFSPPSTTTEAFILPSTPTTEASSTSIKIPLTTTTTQTETRTTSEATDTTIIKISLNFEYSPSTSPIPESIISTDKPETSRPSRYTETTWWYPTMCNDKRCERPHTWITTIRRRKRRKLAGYHHE